MGLLKKLPLLFLISTLFAYGQEEFETRIQTLNAEIEALSEKNTNGSLQLKAAPSRPDLDGLDLFASADFLYWKASEDGLEYALTNNETIAAAVILDGTMEIISLEWDAGFRLDIGTHFPHDEWDLYLDWTYFHNTVTQTRRIPAGGSLSAVWAPPSVANENQADVAIAKWKLQYDTLDLELGRSVFVSKALILRPHFGLRGARINQDLYFRYEGADFSATGLGGSPYNTEGDNNFKGLGARGGLDLNWLLGRRWSISGTASASMVYGKYHVAMFGEFDEAPTPIVNESNGFHRVKSNFETGASLQWQSTINRQRAFLTLALGYELILWLSQNHLRNFNTDGAGLGDYAEMHGDLTLQGFTLSAKIDF